MTPWTDKTKHASTFVNRAITGVGLWDDVNVAWDAPLFAWDTLRTSWENRDKSHSTVMTTNNPFFGWLFWFTQAETDEEGTQWSNKTKH